MKQKTTSLLRAMKYGAIGLSSLMVAGIVTLMMLARGTGEDITGIVSPAALIAIVSGVVAIAAFVAEKPERKAIATKPDNDRTG